MLCQIVKSHNYIITEYGVIFKLSTFYIQLNIKVFYIINT